MVELVRLSGHRLKELPPHEYPHRWAALRIEAERYLPLLQQLDYGYYLDDADRNIPPLDFVMHMLASGEVYFVFNKQDFVGIAAIANIVRGRVGTIEAIATSKYKNSLAAGKAFGELLTYAFKAYSQGGLGLIKLKAEVMQSNIKMILLLQKAGFRVVGNFQAEALCGGVVQDIIAMEKLNPLLFAVDTQVISNAQRAESSQLSHDKLHEPAATSASGVLDEQHSISADTNRSDAARSTSGGDVTPMVAVEPVQQPEQSNGWGSLESTSSSTNGELVQPERDSTTSEPSISTATTNGTELRKLRTGNGRSNTSSGKSKRLPSSTSS